MLSRLKESDRDAARFFSPEMTIWRIDREMALLLGGGRALLMQLAHPKVAAGVADYSHFHEDPLGRLYRTMNTMWSIVFDQESEARASLDRVTDIHKGVQGRIPPGEPLPPGTAYDALDPALLLWVHATLVDSALVTYNLFVEILSSDEKVQYYDETKKLAYLFGVPRTIVPPSLEGFNTYMQEMLTGRTISVGTTARSLAQEILHPRPWILKIGGPLFFLITVGLLPAPLRDAYGLRWNDRKERLFRIVARSIRSLLPVVPGPFRIVPHARAAEKKLRHP
jgi:uncharacterized protein (DUF2236 family)